MLQTFKKIVSEGGIQDATEFLQGNARFSRVFRSLRGGAWCNKKNFSENYYAKISMRDDEGTTSSVTKDGNAEEEFKLP